jgi:hypothetical protein
MSDKLIINRHFLFLHGERLAIFAERVLRNMQNTPYLHTDEQRLERLRLKTDDLREALDNPFLKRKNRTEVVREKEALVLLALNHMADYVERFASCKSDVFTTGFRPQSEQRRTISAGNGTRRQQRMSAKMARIDKMV